MTGDSFVDHVFEATGATAAYRDAVQSCKVRGHITFVGLPKLPPEVDVLNLVFKEIRTSGARVYTPKDFRVAISLLERDAIDVKSVVTDRMPLKDIEEGLRKMHDPDNSLKILFNL